MFKDRLLPHIVILISFLSDPFIWILSVFENDRKVSVFFILFSFLFLIKKNVFIATKDLIWLFSWVSVFMYINIHGMLMGDPVQIEQSYGYLFKILFLTVVIYAIKNDFLRFLRLFFQYNIIIMYAGVALFFLLLLGVDLPVVEFSQGASEVDPNEINKLTPLGIIIDATHVNGILINRSSGLTDEPGQMALLITWLIVLNEFTLKSKFYRNSMMICGIFTFSLAFVFTIIMFWGYFLIVKLKNPVSMVKIIVSPIILALLVYSLSGGQVRNFVDNRIFDRLSSANHSQGLIKGDNRTGAIVNEYEKLSSLDHLVFGLGVTEAVKKNLGQDFSKYGLISIFFMYLPFYLLLLVHRKSIKNILLFIIFINFIQRPGINFIVQMIILTFIYYSYAWHRLEKK
jgi:hypothetical protein